MKAQLLSLAALCGVGLATAAAQTPPAYVPGDLIATFENPSGTDIEFNLGLATSLPASGTEDFGNVASYLSANGQTVATTEWSVAAGVAGDIKGGAATPVNTAAGTVSALPNSLWITQNNSAIPAFVGSASATATPVNSAIATVGTDISVQTATVGPSGLGLKGVAVNAAGDPDSYTSQGYYANVSLNLETLGSGTASLWLLTATTPGVSGKSGTNEGPINGAVDLGSFSLSGTGELTFDSATGGAQPPPAGTGQLVNISSRALVGSGADVEIAGFVISGSSTQVLLRGAGPALAQFGLTGTLAQPVLTLFDSAGNPVATNTGWGTAPNASDIAAAITATGAFAFPSGSADSALLVTLAPGSYTAQIAGAGGTSGVALAEVYKVSGDGELVNISTRAEVQTGAEIEIGGFVVRGSSPVNVLVRAAGPALSNFGLTGVLAQPVLTVVDSSGNTVATNAGWSTGANAADLAADATAAGAFPFASGSDDSAVVLSLQPGAYTAEVTGAGATSGVGLVEVYVVP
jgi:hypothetical protein